MANLTADRKKYNKEYYEKHKKLKGRRKGNSKKKSGNKNSKVKGSVNKIRNASKKMTPEQKKQLAAKLKEALNTIQNKKSKGVVKGSNYKSSNILLEREKLLKEGKTKM